MNITHLEIELENTRDKTKKISSLLLGRGLMNHSVRRLTTGMKNQLKEVANQGGSGLRRALASANIRLFNNIYRIDIHNN